MAEWVPIATAASILSFFLIIILIRVVSNGREQRETVRILNLLLDMVEGQSELISRKREREPDMPAEERPSMVAYQKPSLPREPRVNPPPPPPPAKVKRW